MVFSHALCAVARHLLAKKKKAHWPKPLILHKISFKMDHEPKGKMLKLLRKPLGSRTKQRVSGLEIKSMIHKRKSWHTRANQDE